MTPAVRRWLRFLPISVMLWSLPALAQPAAPLPEEASPVALPADATATEEPPRRHALAEIAVGKRRKAKGPATVNVVPQQQIERQDPRTAADVVRQVPGAHLPTNSRGESLIHLRDAGERQVGVFLDGAQLLIPWDYAVDMSMIPASMIGGVTVVKGASSLLWGANVMGGALNFTTRRLDGPGLVTEVEAQGGMPTQGQVAATHLGSSGAWSWAAAAGFGTREGVRLPQAEDPKTFVPLNQDLDSDIRNNTAQTYWNALARGERALDGGGRVGLTLVHMDADKGVPPESHRDPTKSSVRFWKYPVWQNTMAILSAELPYGDKGEDSVRASAWYGRFAQTIDSYDDFKYTNRTSIQEDQDDTVGARVAWEQVIGPGSLRLVGNGLRSTHAQTDSKVKDGTRTDGEPQNYAQIVASTGVEYEARPTEALSVTAGAGLDGAAMTDVAAFSKFYPGGKPDVFSDYNAAIGVNYAFSKAFTTRLAGGHKSRFPTMREMFGSALNKFVPNPDLQPEQANIAELGVRYDGVKTSGELTLFGSDVSDTIDQKKVEVTEKKADGTETTIKKNQRINLVGSRVLGVEAAASWKIWQALSLDGHLTLMRTRAFDPTTEKYDFFLTRRPGILGTATLQYAPRSGPLAMVQAVYTGSSHSEVGDVAEDPVIEQGNLKVTEVDGAVLVNARVGWRAKLGSVQGEAFVRVDNALDAVFLPTLGQPDPGRTVQAGVKATF